jgi:hypothetical protein
MSGGLAERNDMGVQLTKYEIGQLQRRLSSLRGLVEALDCALVEMKSSSCRQDILQEMERCQAKLDSREGV